MKPLYLETRRLLIRPFQESDAASVFEYAGNERVMRYIQPPFTYTEAEEFVRRYGCIEEPLVYALCRKPEESGGEAPSLQVIGHVIFHPLERRDIYELGFVLGEKYQRRGYAYEAGQALISHGFQKLGLHKIVAEAIAGNSASLHILRKLGLRQEGVLRGQVFHQGEWLDEYRFGILESEYPLLYGRYEAEDR